MYILKSPIENKELPIKIQISFKKIYLYLEEQAADEESVFYDAAKKLLLEVNQYPILREGFSDFSLLHTYETQIQKLLSILFPDLLQSNEIKAASIPFDMTSFMLSKRFKDIIDNAGDDFVFDIRNFDNHNMYIMTCLFILSYVYDCDIDFKRPFFYDIPDVKNNVLKSYRALYNADFASIEKTDTTPEITPEDIQLLLSNFDNLEVWKEKFPPNSYVFNGFGMINLFDVTQDEIISKIKNTFIKRDIYSLEKLEKQIRQLYNISHLKLGISLYSKSKNFSHNFLKHNKEFSLISKNICEHPKQHFCDEIVDRVFDKKIITALPNLEAYTLQQDANTLKKVSSNATLQSIILVPIELNNNVFAVLELASPKKYELNSINANKLQDILPVLRITIERTLDERHNLLESIIQENYTTIHPSVKWKFYNAADAYITDVDHSKKLKSISFKKVYPLYGQCDVKGSSTARNKAIQQDLLSQLKETIVLFKMFSINESTPVFNEMIFKLNNYIATIEKEIKTTDELLITNFFKDEVYPVLDYLKKNKISFKKEIKAYQNKVDDNLHVVYHKRKAYEDFITHLNSALAKHLDRAQKEVQAFYPHYYERFKTDGLDYNMYIGASITDKEEFHPVFVKNLRLWQLQQQCELEFIARKIDVIHTEISLEVTSLILVHSIPLDIRFRMDEKKFDVDGAYNIRYEIIKKRIDKSFIKNTKERLTQPGKIAVVYTHEHDLEEYVSYIKYLTNQGYLQGAIEYLEIEDLQGVSGLKALRVQVDYEKDAQNERISFEKLMKVTQINPSLKS